MDSEHYLADYAAVRDGKGYMGTWAWFKKTFPKYAEIPELDENHHYMILPCDYQEDEETARKNPHRPEISPFAGKTLSGTGNGRKSQHYDDPLAGITG